MLIKQAGIRPPSLQIADLLEISRREHEVRVLCRRYLRETGRRFQSMPCAIYSHKYIKKKIRLMVVRSHLRELLSLYRLMRAERAALFQNYIAALPSSDGR